MIACSSCSWVGVRKKHGKPSLKLTAKAPENRPQGKGDSYLKPPFLGAMLVLGSVSLLSCPVSNPIYTFMF